MNATVTKKETKNGTQYTYSLDGKVIRKSMHRYTQVVEIKYPWGSGSVQYEFNSTGKAGVEERRVQNIQAGKRGAEMQQRWENVRVIHHAITES